MQQANQIKYTIFLVGQKQRMKFLPKIANNFILFESYVYTLAERFIEDYKELSPCWDYHEIEWNGKTLRFMAPKIPTKLPLKCEGMMCYTDVDRFTAGIALTMMALSHLSWQVKGDEQQRLVKQYHDFRAFINDVDFYGASGIYKFLD